MSIKSKALNTVAALGALALTAAGVETFRDYKYGRIDHTKTGVTFALAKNFAAAVGWGFSQAKTFTWTFFEELLKEDSHQEDQKSPPARNTKSSSLPLSPTLDALAANKDKLIHAFMLPPSGPGLPLLDPDTAKNMKTTSSPENMQRIDIA